MARVVMYSTAVCPYCVRAEQLLRSRGVETLEKIRVDLDGEARERMVALTGRRTVPQIFIDGRHIGGCDDLYALDHAGSLMALLAGSGTPDFKTSPRGE